MIAGCALGLQLPTVAAKGNIFISYRRDDSAAYAGRICDHLSAIFGGDRVFMDLEDISPGKNFAQTIDETLAGCDAAVVVIGPRWMDLLRERSQEQQPDYVRHEIEAALARKITVVPALVGGATIAQLAGLPESLAGLSFHQAAELRDSSFKADCARLAASLGHASPRWKWFAGAGIILLLLVLGFAIGPGSEYRARKVALQHVMATARVQMERTEYESAFKTYQDALKIDPSNSAVMDLHADAAMRWVENFHVITGEGQKAEDLAAPALASIQPVLDAALARTNGKGSRAADLLAHMGWTHWLNQHLAQKEFGSAAERDLRQSLTVDPSNVFAHAMLGNWLLQTNGNVDEALRHFDVAVKTGKERVLVRQMQLGGMAGHYESEVRTALIRVASEMRSNGEAMNDRYKRRILSSFNPGLTNAEELKEALTAVPPKDAWATFVWLSDKQTDQRIQHEFVQATLLEIEGKRPEALAMFEALRRELKAKGYSGRIADNVAGAVRRLSR